MASLYRSLFLVHVTIPWRGSIRQPSTLGKGPSDSGTQDSPLVCLCSPLKLWSFLHSASRWGEEEVQMGEEEVEKLLLELLRVEVTRISPAHIPLAVTGHMAQPSVREPGRWNLWLESHTQDLCQHYGNRCLHCQGSVSCLCCCHRIRNRTQEA